MLLFSSDLHFFHKKMLEIRGFTDFETMHNSMIKTWNKKVKEGDTTFILGDLSFGTPEATSHLLSRMNGFNHLVRGNHDNTKMVKHLNENGGFEWIKDYYFLKYNKSISDTVNETRFIAMSHYPMITWDRAHYGSWQLHGHCHGSLIAPETTRLDVGWDVFNGPISMAEIEEIMSTRKYVGSDHHKESKVC